MKPPVLPFLLAALFLGARTAALADGNPDFERDAKPILAAQPGLVRYVHSHFVVKETGVARVPGSADQRPQPPFIFSARPRGGSGPFYLRLLIQPGPAGRILKVADIRQLPQATPEPSPTSEPPPETAETPAPAPTQQPIGSSAPPPQAPAPDATSPSQPSADTPSGPIRD